VQDPKMHVMQSRVLHLPRSPARRRRPRPRPVEAPAPPRGRAWINGREVGGTELRFAHLAAGSD
jgi:hypothetical protein